jgi:hypothetical protein
MENIKRARVAFPADDGKPKGGALSKVHWACPGLIDTLGAARWGKVSRAWMGAALVAVRHLLASQTTP